MSATNGAPHPNGNGHANGDLNGEKWDGKIVHFEPVKSSTMDLVRTTSEYR